MNSLTIQTIRLKNFKGVSTLDLEPFGGNITVMGDNGTGKTTIMDAVMWLLFGKDSAGKADFQIKPVTKDGQEVHNLDTEVEISFDLNGKTITLMKRFKEKWTKKRGAARSEFTGHTTDHFIDDVPEKKGVFDAKISEIIDANAFKLVTNPAEFNLLHWSGMRQILLEMCGDVSDDDVIKANGDLAALAEILGDCTIEDHKKKVAAKKKDINDQLKEIPARIDELSSSIQDAAAPDQKELAKLEKALEAEKEKLRQIQSNERLATKRAELAQVDAEISKAKGAAQDKANERKGPINAEIDRLTAEKREIENQIQALQDDIARDQKRQKITAESMDTLRDQFFKIDGETPEIKTDCPTCGQALPADKIQATRDRFNKTKAERLERNNAEGKSLKETLDSRKKMIQESEKKVAELTAKLPGIKDQIQAKEKELAGVYIPIDVEELDQRKDVLESEIAALKNGSATQEKDCIERIKDLQGKWSVLKTQEAACQAADKSRARIKELEDKEKALAAKYEALEREIHLIEQFVITKVNMLEGQINSRFKLARFKLFNEQINGGIEECCETLYQGVPYNHGLNNAARINVGLDIIRTLSEHYGFRAPIFVDNRESVNRLIDVESQVISLVVSKDKTLRVEHSDDIQVPVEAA